MNKQKIILAAIISASLAAGYQAHAQISPAYSTGDLLLLFHDTASTTLPNMEIDLGSISSFSSLTGTTVLDTVSGVTPTPGYTTLFNASDFTSAFGTLPTGSDPIGFTAAGDSAVAGADTLFMTRVLSSPTLTQPSPISVQQNATQQVKVANQINLIGGGASGLDGTSHSHITAGSSGSVVYVSQGDANSYISQAQDANTANKIDFQGVEPVTGASGGAIEAVNSGSAVYEGLWEVPTTTSGNADKYLGYFTFDPNGEVTFTATPEPSTYALFGLAAAAALAFRRQLRSLIA